MFGVIDFDFSPKVGTIFYSVKMKWYEWPVFTDK